MFTMFYDLYCWVLVTLSLLSVFGITRMVLPGFCVPGVVAIILFFSVIIIEPTIHTSNNAFIDELVTEFE